MSAAKWFMRSFKDGDTHKSAGLLVRGEVTALCGKKFKPLPLGVHGERLYFPADPPDPLQVCEACKCGGQTP